MNQSVVLLDCDQADGIATITLNRPQALNALDHSMSAQLQEALRRVSANDAMRVVVLQGAGAHFMAGGDIWVFQALLDRPSDERRLELQNFIAGAHESISLMRCMGKPIIASVRGAVAGFGLSLMNSCDLAIAADEAFFEMAYCKLGTTPDGSGSFGLPRIVGLKLATEFALLGDRINADRALELGLLNRVVSAADLASATRAMAIRLAEGPALALGRTKALLNDSLSRTLSEQLLAEQESFVKCAGEADFRGAVRAFILKGKPAFNGG
ncbi:enoyl-CoA hydratase/isomerase family protein [Paraburkholderia sp. J67]|uniref:enoyl-CoA hydratase/isomerase family protein n=1 Tax=Paraburkholderia sp. J67 TaxID=2805435 RepID=UPI002ABE3F42|nr:enoyl-CoA hydratase-related protein [Paraburkholderia sp. J67]